MSPDHLPPRTVPRNSGPEHVRLAITSTAAACDRGNALIRTVCGPRRILTSPDPLGAPTTNPQTIRHYPAHGGPLLRIGLVSSDQPLCSRTSWRSLRFGMA